MHQSSASPFSSAVVLAKEKFDCAYAGVRLKHYNFPINNFVGSATSSRRRRYACTPSFKYSFIFFMLLLEFHQK